MIKTSLFIGRFQPFHRGHKKLIDVTLKEGNNVVIALRDRYNKITDPYTPMERFNFIKERYPEAVLYPNKGRIVVCIIPDIDEICYGRKVGWKIRQIHLDENTESISATKIRNKNKED